MSEQCVACGRETPDLHIIPGAFDPTIRACSGCLSRHSNIAPEADRLMLEYKWPAPPVHCLKCGDAVLASPGVEPIYCGSCAKLIYAEFRRCLQG